MNDDFTRKYVFSLAQRRHDQTLWWQDLMGTFVRRLYKLTKESAEIFKNVRLMKGSTEGVLTGPSPGTATRPRTSWSQPSCSALGSPGGRSGDHHRQPSEPGQSADVVGPDPHLQQPGLAGPSA